MPFQVRNGVAVSVSGLEANQRVGGQLDLIVNAYAGNTETDFEPRRAETPRPVPTWTWVLLLAVAAWALAYTLATHATRPPRPAINPRCRCRRRARASHRCAHLRRHLLPLPWPRRGGSGGGGTAWCDAGARPCAGPSTSAWPGRPCVCCSRLLRASINPRCPRGHPC